MIKDYRVYRLNRKEKISSLFEAMLLNAMVSFLFFDSFVAMIPGVLLVILYFKEKRRRLARRRFRELRMEFQEFLNGLIAALQTGRSMENAFADALKDTERYLGKETLFVLEIKKICAGVSVGEPLEKLLLQFSYRSHLEELEYFAEVFSVGKKSGGNLIAIMKNTIRLIQEKMDGEEEIYTVIAEKQMEFHVMCVIPFVIIIYLKISAGTLINHLYGNVTGIFIMTACILIYGGCYLYGKRILEIEI